jgi:hypothetical protein
MTTASQSDEERTRAAEEQNKQAQEEARRKIEEEREKTLQRQRDAVGQTATTQPGTFQEAAKATEALEQPPNFANARELEQPASGTQPAAKNVNEQTLPEETKAENLPTNEATMPSPSSPGSEESPPTGTTQSGTTTTPPPPTQP